MRNGNCKKSTGHRKTDDIAAAMVFKLIIAVIILLYCGPYLLNAQDLIPESEPDSGTGSDPYSRSGGDTDEWFEHSVYETEEGVVEFPEAFDGSGVEPESGLQLSGHESEYFPPDYDLSVPETENGVVEFPEAFDGSGIEPESGLQMSGHESEYFPPDYDLSVPETEEMPGSDGLWELPPIEPIDFAEIYDLSPAQVEGNVFQRRPRDPYYLEIVSDAPDPDITLLGPLPEIREEGIDFTDIAADWMWHQKSAGLTELRGHVMIIYDTTIISCDEATLDEESEIYRFFGEGRVFVDDADFTLECDELVIHDAEEDKMIYITGPSTMVVYADEDAEQPANDAPKREKLEFSLKQQDTIITFMDGEYDYENDIFDAHDGVRFEQPDKYAEGDEFHGENETEYVLFTGRCEFWQADGQWLYEHGVVEDEEEPPSTGDKIKRALLSVPTTITCDEMESMGDVGWLQMRSMGGNVVYFHQDDKHAECDLFTMFYSDEEETPEEDAPPSVVPVVPRNLLEDGETGAEPNDGSEVEDEFIQPRGFGKLRETSIYPPEWRPWDEDPPFDEEYWYGILPHEYGTQISGTGSTEVVEFPSDDDTQTLSDVLDLTELEGVLSEDQIAQLEGMDPDRVSALLGEGSLDYLSTLGPDEISGLISQYSDYTEDVDALLGEEDAPGAIGPEGMEGSGEVGEVGMPITGEDIESPGSVSELTEEQQAIVLAETDIEPGEERSEIIMQGNVFARQENGDWLFEYDVVNEEEEDEDTVEQLRKWANASCDFLHVWTARELVEATGSVYGEQDNQNGSSDFLRYLGKLEMMYLHGNVDVIRENKHHLLSNEAFFFFSTKVFEALGAVRTTVMVETEEDGSMSIAEGDAEGDAEGSDDTSETPPEDDSGQQDPIPGEGPGVY